jgi:serine/threonine-protein kinase HipA
MPQKTNTKPVSLFVFFNLQASWVPCASLTLLEEGTRSLGATLAYGLNYLKRPSAQEIDPLTLSLADKERIRNLNLEPPAGLPLFGAIRDAAPDSWGRRVIEARLKVPANSLPESQYLLHAGSERVGALDVRSTLTEPPHLANGGLQTLPDLLEAADRIQQGLPIPARLENIFLQGSALGGARPKAGVRDEQGVLWLAKFDTEKDPFDIPRVERASLELARRAGMQVPQLFVRSLGNRQVMFIRRFDRNWALQGDAPAPGLPWVDFLEQAPAPGALEHRLGFVSGLTLLGCDESESPQKSYVELADAVRAYCHPEVIREDCEELFRRMVFNILVSNDDDHLRNHGFLWDPRLKGWRLSPLYDVLPRASQASERYLHLGVGQQGRFAHLDNALSMHVRFTPSRRRALEIISEVWRTVREWKVCFEEFDVGPDSLRAVAPAFRHLDAVSSLALRRELP